MIVYDNPIGAKRYGFALQQITKFAHGRKLTILDVGCGMGRLSFPLAELGHNVIGIDEDEELIKQCNDNNKYPNASFIHVDAHTVKDIPLCDVAIFMEVLEHVVNPNQIVDNIKTFLKFDGIVVLTSPNGYCLTEVLLNRIIGKKGKSNRGLKIIARIYCFITGTKMTHTHPFYIDDLHCQFFTLRSIRNIFHNFKIETIQNSDLGLLIAGSGKMIPIKRLECKIADYLPHFMVGGWMMVLKHD